MDKINNISILLSFIGLWLTSFVSGELEILFGFLLIFSFGILHGSNDVLLIESFKFKAKRHTFSKILSIYLLVVLAAVVVFYYIPIVAILLFIIFSAFHFGEQHWEHQDLGIGIYAKMSFYLIYGNFILLLLFVFNISEVLEVIASITDYNLSKTIITYSFIANSIALLIYIILLLLKSQSFKKRIFKELFFLLIFAIIFKVSTLIWGFAIYFIFWHSIPSLFEQVSFIYGDFNTKNSLQYCKNALPYWIISLIGIAIVYFIFKDEKIFYALFFSFIAAVTFPHSIVINTMFKNKKTQSN
jgi:Brp/Blh family beta-carotene 15,15'-monooxygenase